MRDQAPPNTAKETTMRLYNGQHRFYTGIDLHAWFLHVCVLDAAPGSARL
jgi:hypothetical protein